MDDATWTAFGLQIDKVGAFQTMLDMRAKLGAEVPSLYKTLGTRCMTQFKEARAELKKLDAVLTRMEAAARRMEATGKPEQALLTELAAFGGWAVSLLETYVSYMRFVKPQIADAKIGEIAAALRELPARQNAANQRFAKMPDVWQAFAKH